jgi:hypothetical protein
LHRSSDKAAALRASANKPRRNTGATCSQIRGPGLEGRARLRCYRTQRKQPFPGLAAMRARRLRDTVRRMETIEPRERALDLFEALEPFEPKGVAGAVPLFRAAPS